MFTSTATAIVTAARSVNTNRTRGDDDKKFATNVTRFKAVKNRIKAIPHNSKCRYGERGAADAKPKAQIILDVLSSFLATQMPCRSRRSGA